MKKTSIHIMRLACAVILLLAAGCSPDDGDTRAVVRINGKTAITMSEYQGSLKRLMSGHMTSKEELKELKKDLVGRLIEEKLILEEAEKAGVTVAEGELSSEADGLKKEYGEESFKQAVAERYGDLKNWKEEIRRKLLIKKTIETVLGPKTAVREEDAKKYYLGHLKDYITTEQVRARMIVVGTEEAANALRKRLTPANFAEVAKESSLSPEAKDGGDLGYFSRGQMPKEFEDVVFKLKPGKISPVIKTEYGYHIFFIEGRKKGEKLKFTDVKDRITEKLRTEAQDALFETWVSDLKHNSRIEIREDLL